MHNTHENLVRLNVRLPISTFDKLKRAAETSAVPMSALVRMLVVRWALQLGEEHAGGFSVEATK